MIADDTILLTGLAGDDYPGRVVFDDFDEAGAPASGVMQIQGQDGKWHTARRLDASQVNAYWSAFQRWSTMASAEDMAMLWSGV